MGENYPEVTISTGPQDEVLNCGNSLLAVLEGDLEPDSADFRQPPMFRRKETGREYTEES